MINIGEEELIPIREVPALLPRRPNGRRVHISAVYRWVQRGLRGNKLESIKVGGTTYTSVQALQRFAERFTGTGCISGEATQSPKWRQRQAERTSAEVERLLYGPRRFESGNASR